MILAFIIYRYDNFSWGIAVRILGLATPVQANVTAQYKLAEILPGYSETKMPTLEKAGWKSLPI